MSRLVELQDLLVTAVQHPDRIPPAALQAAVVSDRAEPEARIGVYQANVLGVRVRALEKVFPVCQRILGERCFGVMTRDCALEYPQPDREPDSVANRFPDWLEPVVKATESLAGLEYLPDLARFELARHRAWFAPDPPAFNFAAFQASLGAFPVEAHRFTLSDTLFPVESAWPVDRVWEAHRSEQIGPIEEEQGPFHLCIQRSPEGVGHWRIPAVEYQLLRGVAEGLSLGDLQEIGEREGGGIDALLPQFVQQGLVTGFWV